MSDKKRIIRSLFLSICIFGSLSFFAVSGAEESEEAKTISVGMNLPKFVLAGPDSTDDQEYLGLKDLKSFCFSQISAKIIVLEIFSIYCPHCRIQAPALNKIYKFIKQDSQLSNGIKMVGIAAGAKKSEAEGWKTTLHVPFPLFLDTDTTIWQKFGKPGVPITLLVSGTGKVLATHSGPTEDVEDYFRQIKKFYNEQK